MKISVSLFLVAVTLFGTVALCSCENETDKVDTLEITDEAGTLGITDGAETSGIETKTVTFNAVYCSDSASDSDKDAASKLCNAIRDMTGINITYITDNNTEEGLTEILVGNTDRNESKTASKALGENQIRIYGDGSTVCIVAGSSYCLDAGVDKFIELYVTDSGVRVPKNINRTWNCAEMFDGYTVKNPINNNGNDPDVVGHNGTYYYCWSSYGIMISTAPSIDKISQSNGTQVYSPPPNTMYSNEYWAPELHYIQGKWYIYVAADDGQDENHRMYVLRGKTQNPLDGFEMVGKIYDSSDKWAIDGTVVTVKDELYFVWSGWEGDNDSGRQKLYIAHMSSPTTIDSERVQISRPSYSWEWPLNEGPYAVYHGDDIFLLYSASGSWTDNYCISYLKLTNPDNPLNIESWEKASAPILKKSSVAYGPGHCSVALAPDGSYWMVYHANLVAGTGWSGRSVWIQKLEFDENGYPKITASSKKVTYPTPVWRVGEEVL